MLILKRPVGSWTTLTVPPSDKPTVINVQVVRSGYGDARLGFDTPPEVEIVRDDAVQKTKGD